MSGDEVNAVGSEFLTRSSLASNQDPAGIGLAGMRERLAEFGGRLDVHSSNAGSVVRATIPTGHC
jgi:signal transduction histidine kinase